MRLFVHLPRAGARSFCSSTSRCDRQPLHETRYRSQTWEKPTPPPYPHGPARWFKRSDKGLYGGLKVRHGNNVGPKSKLKSRRRWLPNVISQSLYSKALNARIKLRVSWKVIRTVDKVGGLDEYLLGDKSRRIKELGLLGWKLRWAIMQTDSYKARFHEEMKNLGLLDQSQDCKEVQHILAQKMRPGRKVVVTDQFENGKRKQRILVLDERGRNLRELDLGPSVEGITPGSSTVEVEEAEEYAEDGRHYSVEQTSFKDNVDTKIDASNPSNSLIPESNSPPDTNSSSSQSAPSVQLLDETQAKQSVGYGDLLVQHNHVGSQEQLTADNNQAPQMKVKGFQRAVRRRQVLAAAMRRAEREKRDEFKQSAEFATESEAIEKAMAELNIKDERNKDVLSRASAINTQMGRARIRELLRSQSKDIDRAVWLARADAETRAAEDFEERYPLADFNLFLDGNDSAGIAKYTAFCEHLRQKETAVQERQDRSREVRAENEARQRRGEKNVKIGLKDRVAMYRAKTFEKRADILNSIFSIQETTQAMSSPYEP